MPTDWAVWSLAGSAFDWDGLAGRFTFKRATDSVIADAVFVGSVSVADGTFMWSWANETTSVRDRLRMEAVRNFGARRPDDVLRPLRLPRDCLTTLDARSANQRGARSLDRSRGVSGPPR